MPPVIVITAGTTAGLPRTVVSEARRMSPGRRAPVFVAEPATDVGQQRSFQPLGDRDHPFVVLPHAGTFASAGKKYGRGIS